MPRPKVPPSRPGGRKVTLKSIRRPGCSLSLSAAARDGTPRWQVKLLGLDVFDPITMQPHHAAGDDGPCWMLDTAYNGMVFHADQVFFPKTAAWDSLRRALRGDDDAVSAHLAGGTSAPFAAAISR